MSTIQKHISVNQFEERKQTAEFGMWLFLAGEVLFFGALFLVYFVYRHMYPQGFAAGGREVDLASGFINTLILNASSLFMALSVEAARKNLKSKGLFYLVIVGFLGVIFLSLKAQEYIHKIDHGLFPGAAFLPGQHPAPGMEMFFSLYFVLTGIHSLHLIVGLGLLVWIFIITARNESIMSTAVHLDIFGLYWHFVDIVWVFIFPFFYLVGRF